MLPVLRSATLPGPANQGMNLYVWWPLPPRHDHWQRCANINQTSQLNANPSTYMFQIQWLHDKRSKMGKTDNKRWSIRRDIYAKHPAICETTTGTAGLVGSVPGICDINIIGIPPDTSEDRAIHHRAMKTTTTLHLPCQSFTWDLKMAPWNRSFLFETHHFWVPC